ncbi:MAG: hypothetical protein WCH40_03260 [Verrucomicrobiales bacterium]
MHVIIRVQADDSYVRSFAQAHALRLLLQRGFVDEPAEVALARVKEFSAPVGIPADAAPATLACWAWGYSRMVDVLEKQPEIDAARIAAVGHSRNGNACLFASAMDERIALAIPTQAGQGISRVTVAFRTFTLRGEL